MSHFRAKRLSYLFVDAIRSQQTVREPQMNWFQNSVDFSYVQLVMIYISTSRKVNYTIINYQ